MSIRHFTGTELHEGVDVFVGNDGSLGLRCPIDGTEWEFRARVRPRRGDVLRGAGHAQPGQSASGEPRLFDAIREARPEAL